MAKVTTEHFKQFKSGEKSLLEISQIAGVSKQAVASMFKKYEIQQKTNQQE